MCLGGKQPEAPVNTPDYTPDQADTRFVTTKTDESGKTETIPQEGTIGAPKKAPSVKTTTNTIRM